MIKSFAKRMSDIELFPSENHTFNSDKTRGKYS